MTVGCHALFVCLCVNAEYVGESGVCNDFIVHVKVTGCVCVCACACVCLFLECVGMVEVLQYVCQVTWLIVG